MPEWIRGDILDVRSVVLQWRTSQTGGLGVQVTPYASHLLRYAHDLKSSNTDDHSHAGIRWDQNAVKYIRAVKGTGSTGIRR